MAEELVAAKGEIATAEALAKAREYEANGYHPAARSWREIAAWCENILVVRFDQIELKTPNERVYVNLYPPLI